jgi:hypothetical protein
MQRLNGGAEGDRTLDLRIAKAMGACKISELRSFGGLKRAYSGGCGARMWHTGKVTTMSEQPAQYSRTFVCRICGKSFEPDPDEAEALAELERAFGMRAENASSVCEECAGRSVQ